jgi:hypothetical protein
LGAFLMNEQTEDWFDLRLREEIPYIDDAGFTARVMRELPRGRSFRTQRSIILLLAAIVSAVAAYFASGEGMFLRELIMRIAALPLPQLFALVFGCGLLAMIGALWAALARVRDPLA